MTIARSRTRNKSKNMVLAAAVLGAMGMVGVSNLQAGTIYWDANGATAGRTDGLGIWTAANLWNPASDGSGTPQAWVDGEDAVIGNGGAGGIITVGTVTANKITFNAFTGTYNMSAGTLTLNSGGILINSGAGAVTRSAAVTLGASQSWTNNGANTFTVSSVAVTGGGNSLTLDGTGNGLTNLSGGISFTGAGGLIVSKTGTNGVSLAGTITLGGTGGITINSGASAFSMGAATVSVNQTFTNNSANGAAITGALALGGNTLTFDGSGNWSSSQAVTGPGGSIIKNGAGTLTLTSGSTSRTGTTTINGGVYSTGAAWQAFGAGAASSAIFWNGGEILSTHSNNTSIAYSGNSGLVTVGGNVTFTMARANSGVGIPHNFRGISIGTNTLTVQRVSGNLTSDSTLNFTGNSGTTTLTGSPTFNIGAGTILQVAATTVASGQTLTVNGDGKLTAASLTVNSGGKLAGSGTITNAVTVAGAVAPGNSIGTLNAGTTTWKGAASASAATDWVYELGTANTADLLNITGNFTKDITAGSAFRFNFSNSAFAGTFKLVDWSGSTTFASTDFSYTNLASGYTGSFQFTGSQLEFVSTATGGGPASIVVTPGDNSARTSGQIVTIDATPDSVNTYDISGTSTTGYGWSQTGIADATGTTGDKVGTVTHTTTNAINGSNQGRLQFTIASASSGNDTYNYTLSSAVSGNVAPYNVAQTATILSGNTLTGYNVDAARNEGLNQLGTSFTIQDSLALVGDKNLSMTIRERIDGTADDETTANDGLFDRFASDGGKLFSDVVSISGINGTVYVLTIAYDPADLDVATEASIRLGWLNGSTQWVNAVQGNTSGTPFFAGDISWQVGIGGDGLQLGDLGKYGVYTNDVGGNYVWAVLNHNSEFAVIPEPASLGLLALGGLALLGRRRRTH